MQYKPFLRIISEICLLLISIVTMIHVSSYFAPKVIELPHREYSVLQGWPMTSTIKTYVESGDTNYEYKPIALIINLVLFYSIIRIIVTSTEKLLQIKWMPVYITAVLIIYIGIALIFNTTPIVYYDENINLIEVDLD